MSKIESLRLLQNKTGQDLLSRLIQLYVDEVPEQIKKMKFFLDEKDFVGFGRLAHSLKSSSGNLGAFKLVEINQEIEKMTLEEENYDEQILGQLFSDLLKFSSPTIVQLKALVSF